MPTLPSMSCPTDSVKNAPPLFTAIATNHGSASASTMSTPRPGRSARNQRAERSRKNSASTASAANIGTSGPLTSTPAATASQKISTVESGSRAAPRTK